MAIPVLVAAGLTWTTAALGESSGATAQDRSAHRPSPREGHHGRPVGQERCSGEQLRAAAAIVTTAVDDHGWSGVVAVSRRPDMTGLVIEVAVGTAGPGLEDVQSLVEVPVAMREVEGFPIPRPAQAGRS